MFFVSRVGTRGEYPPRHAADSELSIIGVLWIMTSKVKVHYFDGECFLFSEKTAILPGPNTWANIPYIELLLRCR